MVATKIPEGTVHKMPADLRKALTSHKDSLAIWNGLTPLSRNEWICWVESAKLIDTRTRRVERVVTELVEGVRRPCCWIGCIHRTDKAISPSVRAIIDAQKKSK